jgi:hypothetical protein
MTQNDFDSDFTVVKVCSNHIDADIVANFLRGGSVPAVVRTRAPVPGLEQGAEVLVPNALADSAKWLLAQKPPSDAELSELAARTPPEPDGPRKPKKS